MDAARHRAGGEERGRRVLARAPPEQPRLAPRRNGQLGLALDAFEGALGARERRPEDPAAIAVARFAVGKALRALGRSSEAIPLLERAVAWTQQSGAGDGWFHEELAEEYAAVGRADDAREQARRAIPLLEAADPSFAEDAERLLRLRELAAPSS